MKNSMVCLTWRMVRPTFLVDGQPVRAAGILFYYLYHGRRYYLFRRERGRWSDIGGKTEQEDTSPLDTAIRECVEETNGHMFSACHTNKQCLDHAKQLVARQQPSWYYDTRAKYLVYTVCVPRTLGRNMKRFGKRETHTNQTHYYKWMSVPYNVHPRLRTIKKQL